MKRLPLQCFVIFLLLVSLAPGKLYSQVGIGTTSPNSSSALEISSSARGILIPRMSASQIAMINLPATGLLVYQTDGSAGFYYNSGTPALPNWVYIISSETGQWLFNNNDIYNSNSGNVGIGVNSPNSSAILDVSSSSKGMLVPRMTTTQRNSISLPATGLVVFQTDGISGFYYNSGLPTLPHWDYILSSAASQWSFNNNDIYNTNTANVGIGTSLPATKLAVGINSEFRIDNLGNIVRINNIPYSFPSTQGGVGQFLSNNGNGILSWAEGSQIYTITPSNFQSISIPSDNYVKIQGTINLTANYTGLNGNRIIVTGGVFNGNGSYVITIGSNAVFNGTTFLNTDIDCQNATFINCSFSGNCPRIGSGSRFINCQFNGVTTGPIYVLGTVENSMVDNCILPRTSEFINVTISNSNIGNGSLNQNSVNTIEKCNIISTLIYSLQNDFSFSNNKCRNTKLIIGNMSQTSNVVNISNNQFNNFLSGHSEIIEINPTSTYFKLFSIQNNSFLLQPSDPRSILISPNDGNPLGYALINIQGNTFWRGLQSLQYSSSIKVNYSQNISFNTLHPSTSGNLFVNGNYSY